MATSRQRIAWQPPPARLEGDRLLKARNARIAAIAEVARELEMEAETTDEKIESLRSQLSDLRENLPQIVSSGGGGRRMVKKVLERDFGLPEGPVGDMRGNTYDPNNRRLDVFDMDSMQDGDNKVAMTAQERAAHAAIKTPFDFGAPSDIAEDDDASEYIQALFDAVRASWSYALWNFTLVADLAGRKWRVETSLSATDIRQPWFTIQNGGLYGACADKIVLDLAGTNTPVLMNVSIYGDRIAQPSVGLLLSRTKIDGVIGGVPQATLIGVQANGYYTKSAFVNFAAEEDMHLGCVWTNMSRSTNAYAYINVGNAQTLEDYVGGLSSEYATLPVVADGTQSNILHSLGRWRALRPADLALPVSSITKANPAVVSVSAASLASRGLTNGEKVYFHDVVGMTQLNGNVYTVANVNLTAGTFELSGTNSTSYGTFTSGYVWNQTGPAVLLNRSDCFRGREGYLLTYGAPGIVVDTINGGSCRALDLEFSHEAHPPSMMRIDKPSSGVGVWQGFRIKNFSINQYYLDTIIDDTGAGALRFDDFELVVTSMPSAPPNKVFKNPTRFRLQNANVVMPLAAALNDYSEFTTPPQGSFTAHDRSPQTFHFGGGYRGMPDFYGTSANPTALRAVLEDDGSGAGPYFDLKRVSASPANADALGAIRFYGRDASLNEQVYSTIRARVVEAANGSEAGRLEIVNVVAGADALDWFFQGAGIYDGVNKVLGKRVTGFTTAAGIANKDASGINVGTITATDANIRAVAAWVKALHDAMASASGHGLIN